MPSENTKGTTMTTHHVELRKVTKRFGAQKAVSQVDLF
ncbi:ABC transporter ATP-binding protein [Neisseria gonorrhoeae]|nr:ABC transporter ATP-binding protein [Neisseria gonorrhoeae]